MIAAIIQARMGSSRLPGKVLKKVCGKTLLELMIERIQDSKTLEKIIVATSTDVTDEKIVQFCEKRKIPYFRGSENDVLSRYKMTAEKFQVDTVVRLTGDTPLLNYEIIDDIVYTYIKSKNDFVSNCFPLPRTYPDGMNVEVFSRKILDEINEKATKPSEREHVTFYILNRPEEYKILRVDLENDLSRYRFNLDYQEDYELIKKIFENLYTSNPLFSLNEITEFLKKNPVIFKLNSEIRPFEGILKSFNKDKEKGFSEINKFFTSH